MHSKKGITGGRGGGRKRGDNIKWILTFGWDGANGINLDQDTELWWVLRKRGNKNCLMEGNMLSDYQLLDKHSAPWS